MRSYLLSFGIFFKMAANERRFDVLLKNCNNTKSKNIKSKVNMLAT